MFVLCVVTLNRVACIKKLGGSNSNIIGVCCNHEYRCNFDSLGYQFFSSEFSLFIYKIDLMEIIVGNEDLNVYGL